MFAIDAAIVPIDAAEVVRPRISAMPIRLRSRLDGTMISQPGSTSHKHYIINKRPA